MTCCGHMQRVLSHLPEEQRQVEMLLNSCINEHRSNAALQPSLQLMARLLGNLKGVEQAPLSATMRSLASLPSVPAPTALHADAQPGVDDTPLARAVPPAPQRAGIGNRHDDARPALVLPGPPDGAPRSSSGQPAADALPVVVVDSPVHAVDAAVVVTGLKLEVGQAELERWLGRAATVENIGLFRPGQALVQHYNMPGAAEQVQAIQHDQVGLHLANGPAGLTAHFAASATHTASAPCFFAGHILHLLLC
jgi:hypothetical protein